MIRSMSSALSGLRNHQVMLDVVGNDIANVSTVGFKSATVQSFTQGAIQRTGRTTDIAIQGDGFFVVNNGNENLYTRAGSFMLDANGNLTTPDGMLVQGWQADQTGAINTNAGVSSLEIRVGELLPPTQTSNVDLGGNLSADAAVGTTTTLTVSAYDDQGVAVPLNLTFTKSAANEWTVTGSAGNPAVAIALTDNVLTFDGTGELIGPADRGINIAANVIPNMPSALTIDLGAASKPGRLTQYAGATTASITQQNGSPAGSLQSFNVGQDGTIVGSYSNGKTRSIGRVALAVFTNPGGLERVAGVWRETPNSGLAQVGTPGAGGRGLMSSGTLEMSNVDLAEEFTRLIIAQRGFQGNARVVSTADDILQEVVNLRR